MSQYTTGTCNVTNGSQIVTGSGTTWTTLTVGDPFKILNENAAYIIGSIDSNTQIHLTSNYAGTTKTNQNYIIGVNALTATNGLYRPSAGDIDWPFLLSQTMDKIDAMLPSVVGNASGNVPISNETVCTNLNSDMIDGFHASQTPGANQIPVTDASGNLVISGVSSVIKKINGTMFTQLGNDGVYASGTDLVLLAPAGKRLIFYSNNAQTGMFDSTGNLIIGTTSGNSQALKVRPSSASGGGVDLGAFSYGTNSYGPLTFTTSNAATPQMSIDASGNLLVGVTSGSNHIIHKAVAEGSLHLNIGATNGEHYFFAATGAAGSGAACVYKVNKNSTNSRSINAGGTINASGADYAEYETKSNTCCVVAKGQIIGFDSNGNVTDKWAESISFGVKSTNPNLVGGDTWGTEDKIGKRPEQPAVDADKSVKDQYEIDFAAFETKLEEERQKVDRIAYSGKVPVNILGASVGDYIIVVQDNEGIKGEAITNPSFEQYRLAVGRVRKILEDGRAEIAVIVH